MYKKRVPYVDGIRVEERVQVPVYKSIMVMTKAVKVSQDKRLDGLLLRISSVEQVLLKTMCDKMDDDNMISIDSAFRLSFISRLEKNLSKSYSDAHIRRCLMNLSNTPLVHSEKRKVYYVNPIYYWKSDKEREKSIKFWMENVAKT